MANELLAVLDYLEQERGIARDIIIDAIEKALVSAGRKSIHPSNTLTVKINPKTGDIRAWASLIVVEKNSSIDQINIAEVQAKLPSVKVGDLIDWEVTPSNFGRIAAQAARQAIMQHLNKAEKNMVRDEYESRVGEIVNGTIKRLDRDGYIVDFHRAEGIITNRDRIKTEQYAPGDRVNALLIRVESINAGPSLILSRTHTDFIRRLFEREVTELRDGNVEIVSIAREPGVRTKIAVRSKDSNIDAIGTCVGPHGMRVKNVTAELGGDMGERIDIMLYAEDPTVLVKDALKPAKVTKATLSADGESIDVHLTEEESRRAYGKRAFNLKLAQRLLGRQINFVLEESEIKEESFELKQRKAIESLANELGLERPIAEKLVAGGFLSVEQLREAANEDIEAVEKLEDKEIDLIMDALDELDNVNTAE